MSHCPANLRHFSFHGEISREHPLLSRVDLIHDIACRVCVPGLAGVGHDRRQHSLLQQSVLLDGVDVQARAHVPGDVAMEGPRAWVVRVVLQDDVPGLAGCVGTLDQLRVATLRVLLVGDFTVPRSLTLCEHVEVVAVEMHGVGGNEIVVDYKAD